LRVVSLIASGTEIVHALGAGHSLVGRSHECDYPPHVQRLPAVTEPKFRPDGKSYEIHDRVKAIVQEGLSVYRVDAERLGALRPDVVITQMQCEVCAVSERDVETALRDFTHHRPRVLSLRPDSLADVWNDIMSVAIALGVFDGAQIPNDIRKGVWVCFEGDSEYIRNCFQEYNVVTDPSGRYMSSYKKWHLIGLELGISVAAIALRSEPTGVATCFNADVAATAKKNLQVGDTLDGEGGYTVFGKLTPASTSLAKGYLPLGLAHDVRLIRPVAKDSCITWADVAIDETLPAVRVRKEQEALYSAVAKRA